MIPLKYQTSNQKFILGQFLSTDENTVAAALTINSSDVALIKFNSTIISYKSTTGLTHISSGFYGGSFSSDDTDTLGSMDAYVHMPTSLLLKREFSILTEDEYNRYTSTTYQINVYSTLVDLIWDELLTGATHNVATSAGRRLRDIASNIIITGTSPNTAGTANTAIRIELDAAASTVNGTYDPSIIMITDGTGVGQTRQIFEYDGVNKYAYINRDWKIIPDNTSVYVIVGNSGDTHQNEGLVTGVSSNTITLNSLASTNNNTYKGQIVFIFAGNGQDQAKEIISYDGATKIATIESDWIINPSTNSIYAILPHYCNSTYTADNIFASYIESTETVKDTLKLLRAVNVGASTGGGGSTVVFYSPNSTIARITTPVSTDGNRGAPTINLT